VSISVRSVAGVAPSWWQIRPTTMKLCMRTRCSASSCMHATPYFRQNRTSAHAGSDSMVVAASSQMKIVDVGALIRPARRVPRDTTPRPLMLLGSQTGSQRGANIGRHQATPDSNGR
jgi:hypothetical protein